MGVYLVVIHLSGPGPFAARMGEIGPFITSAISDVSKNEQLRVFNSKDLGFTGVLVSTDMNADKIHSRFTSPPKASGGSPLSREDQVSVFEVGPDYQGPNSANAWLKNRTK